MKTWILFKENYSFDIDQRAYEVWADRSLFAEQNIIRPLRFAEILSIVNERDRRRSDIKILPDEIIYSNPFRNTSSRIFTADNRCCFEAESNDDPLVMLLYRLGRVVFLSADQVYS